MNGHDDGRRQRRGMGSSPQGCNRQGSLKHGLNRGTAHADNDRRFERRRFRFQPRSAGANMLARRFLMEAQLAFLKETKMFDGVGHVGIAPIDPGVLQGFIEQVSRRTNEWLALFVLLVAGLLPQKNHPRRRRPLAENRLYGPTIQLTPAASLYGSRERRQPRCVWYEWLGGGIVMFDQ